MQRWLEPVDKVLRQPTAALQVGVVGCYLHQESIRVYVPRRHPCRVRRACACLRWLKQSYGSVGNNSQVAAVTNDVWRSQHSIPKHSLSNTQNTGGFTSLTEGMWKDGCSDRAATPARLCQQTARLVSCANRPLSQAPPMLSHSEDVWYEDGNLVLQVGRSVSINGDPPDRSARRRTRATKCIAPS